MTFQREPRYWVRRRHQDNRYAYLNDNGQETIAPIRFGEQWSNGLPHSFTYHQARLAQNKANDGRLGALFHCISADHTSYNA